MSNLQYTISIKNNSNKIISSSEEKFIGVRDGSLIKIDDDSNLYTINGRDNYFYIKNFSVSDSRTIILDEDVGMDLQAGDNLKISFKEWELSSITDIIDGGSSYQNEEEISISGGKLNIDISSGVGNPSTLEVKEVNGDGKIQIVGIKNKGKYISPPQNPIEVNSRDGIGAKFELKYVECSERAILERTINSIYTKENKTLITLNYSLPLNLKQGKISVEKNYLLLDKNYLGSDKRNVKYTIYKDYTPHLRLPNMARNTLSPDICYNKTIQILDAEIKAIKDKIGM